MRAALLGAERDPDLAAGRANSNAEPYQDPGRAHLWAGPRRGALLLLRDRGPGALSRS